MVKHYSQRAYGRLSTISNRDYFERNIVTTRCGCGSCGDCTGAADLRTRNLRRSNVPWCPWPTYEDVQQWATSEGALLATGEDGTANSEAMNSALMAAITKVSEGTLLPYFEVDADGVTVFYEADGVTVTTEALGGVPKVAKVPRKVRAATIMHAHRLYRRRLSPDGTLGSSAFGGQIRVSKYDPDIRKLLGRWLVKGVAG